MMAVVPRFLLGLDHVRGAPDGGYVAQCPVCRGLLHIVRERYEWLLDCQGGCSHDELVRWLACDVRRAPTPSQRMWVCMMLAGRRLDVFEALLRDEPVPLSALAPLWVRRLRLPVSGLTGV